MRVLVIGYGSMGRRHAESARALGHAVSVLDADEVGRRAADARGFCAVATPRDACDAGPDRIVIATPASTHAALLAWWLPRSDAQVLVEKPLGLSAAEFAWCPDALVRRISVGYNWRFHPLLTYLRHRVRTEGGDAPVVGAALWSLCDMATWPGRGYAAPLLELSHEIDLALALCGPQTLDAAASCRRATCWDLTLSRSHVILDGASPVRLRGLRIRTAADYDGGYDVDATDPREAAAVEASYAAEMAAFLDGDDPTLATFADGMAVLAICDQARRRVLDA